MTTAGVVLCGGQSERMGQSKITIPFLGRPMLAHVVDQLHAVCDPIVVACGVFHNDAKAALSQHRSPIAYIQDQVADGGPLVGLVSAFCQLRQQSHNQALVVSVDLPLLNSSILKQLADHRSAAQAVLLADDHRRINPLAGRYQLDCTDALADAVQQGVRRSMVVTELLDHEVLPLSAFANAHPTSLLNVNTRQQLQAAEQLAIA